jgi:hypothetical protein
VQFIMGISQRVIRRGVEKDCIAAAIWTQFQS